MSLRVAHLFGYIVVAIAVALLARSLFPKTVTVAGEPRIFTRYDTVRTIDTAWVARIRHDTVRVNLLERVIVTVPETVRVVPELRGIRALEVGAAVGDSTLVFGFTIAPADSQYSVRRWQAQFYTQGPLKSVALDSIPRVAFYPPPGKPCRTLCKVGHYLVGAVVGAGIISAVK